jgi:hypothetical protein
MFSLETVPLRSSSGLAGADGWAGRLHQNEKRTPANNVDGRDGPK